MCVGKLDIPAVPGRVLADWDREIDAHVGLELGDVEVMPLARTRMRWRELADCVTAMAEWMPTLGLPDVLTDAEIALMVCRGARYHHDVAQYGDAAFCNLFLSEDKGLDLYFPHAERRIPLTRGTAVLFDTAQPHGVVPRDRTRFDERDFLANADYSQVFLSWELPIETAHLARVLHIDFDVSADVPPVLGEGVVTLDGLPVTVRPESGAWQQGHSSQE